MIYQRLVSSSLRQRSNVSLLGFSIFSTLLGLAAAAYPGGTWWDRDSEGFQVAQNFWSDLLRTQSLNGESNQLGALTARIALLVLALSLVPFWTLIERHYGLSKKVGRALKLFGWMSCLGLALVACVTGVMPPQYHTWTVLVFGPSGVLAIALGVIASFRGKDRGAKLSGGLAIILSLVNLAQYAREALSNVPSWVGLPLVQKLATVALLLWLGTVSWSARTHSAPRVGS